MEININFRGLINNFLTKKLQFDYIQLICNVLSKSINLFPDFDKKVNLVLPN